MALLVQDDSAIELSGQTERVGLTVTDVLPCVVATIISTQLTVCMAAQQLDVGAEHGSNGSTQPAQPALRGKSRKLTRRRSTVTSIRRPVVDPDMIPHHTT